MKKIKFNLLAIIGMMVAVGTVAFTAPKLNPSSPHWYVIEGNDIETAPFAGPDGENCITLPLSTTDCAVEYKMLDENASQPTTLAELDLAVINEEVQITNRAFKKDAN